MSSGNDRESDRLFCEETPKRQNNGCRKKQIVAFGATQCGKSRCILKPSKAKHNTVSWSNGYDSGLSLRRYGFDSRRHRHMAPSPNGQGPGLSLRVRGFDSRRSRHMRYWCNGSISVFQTEDAGSNPVYPTTKYGAFV